MPKFHRTKQQKSISQKNLEISFILSKDKQMKNQSR
jgi:hypothetical protein